jgi:hypothetical protein
MANATKDAVLRRIENLGWMIEDAKRDLQKTALQIQRRGAEAVESCNAMIADQPCSTGWVDFAAGDMQRAVEAKARLMNLIEQLKVLQYIAEAS